MTSQCLPLLQFDAVRITKLNSCGTPQTGSCAYATSAGVISLAMTNENLDRQEYLQTDGQGRICVLETTETQLKWINVELQFCSVDPELFNLILAESLVLNDFSTPTAIGWDTTTQAPLNSFFGLEGWTNTGSDSCTDNQPDYGYFVMPFIIGAQLSDVTLENGNINFTITGRTKARSLWGTGPYNVRLIEAAGPTNGVPAPLLSTVGSTLHRRMFWTELPPPPTFCGCQNSNPPFNVAPASATAVTLRTATIPIDPVTGVGFAGYLTWGDAAAPVLVAAGTVSLTHTYAVGSYTATFKPTSYSTPTYSVAIVAS